MQIKSYPEPMTSLSFAVVSPNRKISGSNFWLYIGIFIILMSETWQAKLAVKAYVFQQGQWILTEVNIVEIAARLGFPKGKFYVLRLTVVRVLSIECCNLTLLYCHLNPFSGPKH